MKTPASAALWAIPRGGRLALLVLLSVVFGLAGGMLAVALKAPARPVAIAAWPQKPPPPRPMDVEQDAPGLDHALIASGDEEDPLGETGFGRRTLKLEVGQGDTLLKLLTRDGDVDAADANQAIAALGDAWDPRSLKPGQEIELTFDQTGEDREFFSLSMSPSVDRTVSVERQQDGGYEKAVTQVELTTKPVARAFEIHDSLLAAGRDAGIPMGQLLTLIRLYSYDVDFQRDIQPGNRLEVLYETLVTPDGALARSGDLLFARLTLDDQVLPIYRFKTDDGEIGYYTETGVSIRKTLLKTPVDGVRVTSGFGMRRHPVLGYSRMHRGIDFGAPTGTPIFAAGDGVVAKVGGVRGYGNYIRLRHNGTTETAYAHMSRYARGMSVGTRVRQGQVIGYVGSTGMSTGPHLHFEVLVGGEQVNPLNVAKTASGNKLGGKELARFKSVVADVQARMKAQGVVAAATKIN